MSTQSKHIKILFGAFSFASYPAEKSNEFLDALTRYNVIDLDTARIYVRTYPFPQDSKGKIFY